VVRCHEYYLQPVSLPNVRRDNTDLIQMEWKTLSRLLSDISHNPAAVAPGDQELFAELFSRSLHGKGDLTP
jgi:hypothetical protein